MDSPVEIIRSIQKAFAQVARGSITLHQAEVIDSDGSELDQQNARLLDQETSWDQVPDSSLEECTSALCHLDPESWRYYLPAYLVWSIRNYQHSDAIMIDFTIYSLKPSEENDLLTEYDMTRYRLLDHDQSTAVFHFLDFMAQQDEFVDAAAADEAIDLYWHQFGPGSID